MTRFNAEERRKIQIRTLRLCLDRERDVEIAALRMFQKIEGDYGAPWVGEVKRHLLRQIVSIMRKCYVTENGMLSHLSSETQIANINAARKPRFKRKKWK
jgi:hypothetical protein